MFHPSYFATYLRPEPTEPEPTVYIVGPSFVIAINRLTAALIDIVGPFAWAALIVLYVFAQLQSR